MKTPIAIASDHAGYNLKETLKDDLCKNNYDIMDLGTNNIEPVDYTEFAFEMANLIELGKIKRGVLCCGTGIGVAIAANRFPEVRAANVHESVGASFSRKHNDANVICFGQRIVGQEVARNCLQVFLQTDFEGGRHLKRIEKLSKLNLKE